MGTKLYITGILLDLDEGNPQARRALGERVKRHLWFIISPVVLRTVTVLHLFFYPNVKLMCFPGGLYAGKLP